MSRRQNPPVAKTARSLRSGQSLRATLAADIALPPYHQEERIRRLRRDRLHFMLALADVSSERVVWRRSPPMQLLTSPTVKTDGFERNAKRDEPNFVVPLSPSRCDASRKRTRSISASSFILRKAPNPRAASPLPPNSSRFSFLPRKTAAFRKNSPNGGEESKPLFFGPPHYNKKKNRISVVH